MHRMESENDTYTPVMADEIKRLRDSIGWTQKDLERAADVSMSTVQRAERGDPTLKAKTLRPLAGALGVPLSQIYAVEDPPGAHGATASTPQPGSDQPPPWAVDMNTKLDRILTILESRP